MNAAVACGVMAATAVLTGALLVGDSVRGSLQSLALDRLGQIDEVLVSEQFFRAALADELAAAPAVKQHYQAVVPVLLLQGTVEKPDSETPTRANQVTLLGGDERFWQLGDVRPARLPEAGEIVVNAPLAEELGAQVGDELLIRLPLAGAIPSESPLGKKNDTVTSQRLKLIAIVPAESLGRFGLRPTQQLPRNAYVAPATLQQAFEQPDRVNALLVASEAAQPPSAEASAALQAALNPLPTDYGLTIERVQQGAAEAPASDYFNLTSERMLLPAAVVKAAREAFDAADLQPALTYLANTIEASHKPNKKIPYSTVAGVDAIAALGPLLTEQNQPLQLGDNEIALNSWAAADLGVKPGDTISLRYYEPVSTHGELVEPPAREFTLREIVPLPGPGELGTQASDPHFTPELKGVTDQASIDDWDLPFELVEEIRKPDETYWDDYRTTPKAFVSLAAARRMWSSRFGDTTSLRIPYAPGLTAEAVFEQLKLDPVAMGLEFQPVKRQVLAAAAGTTPFNLLFLGFSFFLIASAVMLTAILFRLGLDLRGAEIGLLAAIGWRRRQLMRLHLGEASVIALFGAGLGVALGVAYAWLMLAGLRTLWLEAVTTPFLQLYITPASLLIGLAAGVLVALGTIALSLRKLLRQPARQLLAGRTGDEALLAPRQSRLWQMVAGGLLIVAVLTGFSAMGLSGEAQAGAFFGSGFLVLASCLLGIWSRWRSAPQTAHARASMSLAGLAARNGARNPGRGTLTIGLVAAASFLIVAISAFRLAPTDEGTGGFALWAESDQPLLYDLNTPDGRFELAFNNAQDELLASCQTYSFRVRAGDDASCLNLYRPTQPRVLGASEAFLARGGFAWAASAADDASERENPWLLLKKSRDDGVVPVVLDMNTALYSLHLWSGVGEQLTIEDGQGGQITLEVVGLLKNSVLQGELLISEANFLRHFPQTGGYRLFLIDVPGDLALPDAANQTPHEAVGAALEARLGDWGFDATPARARLEGFLAVQNTYLSTFQSLGALGLLLGTLGLATVQLRNVVERRGELALMRAAGFRRRRLAGLVMLENGVLLLAGLAVGVGSALVAVLPHWLLGGARVPWLSLAMMLAVVLVVGLLAGLLAVRATLRAPIVAALRGG